MNETLARLFVLSKILKIRNNLEKVIHKCQPPKISRADGRLSVGDPISQKKQHLASLGIEFQVNFSNEYHVDITNE